jgi:TP901 family phage tail tape measure protein
MPSEEIGSAYAKLGLDDKELDRGLSSAKGKFSSAISSMESGAAKTGKAIGAALATGAVAAGVALAGVATGGVKTFMDIESAAADAASKMDLSAIAQASGKSIEEAFVGVKEHVMALSDELGQLNTNAFDPTTIAQACADLASGGFDVATASAKDLSPMLALATATNYDLGQSCAMVTNAMSIYGKGVEDITNISDIYARACADSKMGMEELNYSMKMAGPAAAAYGVDLETTVAFLENFAEKGIKGEMAGTALRDIFNSLGAPTKTVSDGLLAMGLSAKDVDPRFNDVNESLKKMYAAAQKSGEGAAAFTKVFGVNGALIYGLAEGSAKTDEFRGKLLDCAGAAETMARLMLDSLGGSLEAAMGAASSLAYLIGGKLAPTLKSAFEWFSSTGAPAIRSFIEALSSGDFSAAGAQIGITVEKIKSAVAGLATGAGIVVFAAGLASLIPVAASMAAGVVASAAAMVAGTAASVAAMVAAHVSGFASMVAASVSSWASMKAQAIASWLSMKLAAVASMALTVETTLAGYATMAATAAANMGMMATSTIGKFAAMALGAVASALSMAASVVAAFGAMATNAALRLGTMTSATLAGYAKMAAGALASVAAMVAGTLAGFASMVAGVVASVAGMAASLAAPLLLVGAGLAAIGLAADPSKFTTLGKIGSDALKGLKSVASDCWEAIKKGDFSAVATRLKTAFSSSVDYIKNINWSGVGSDIVAAIGAGWDTLKGYAATAGAAAMDALKSAFAFGSDIANGLYEDFQNINWGGVWDSLVSAWDSAIAKLSDVGSTILGYFDSIDWGTVGFKIGTAIRDAIVALADIGQKVWDYLTSPDWSGAGSSISEKVKVGLAKLKEYWTEFKTGLMAVDWSGAGKELGDKIKAGIAQITEWAKPIYEKLKKGWDDWIAAKGPTKLGEDFAHSLIKGVVDLGKWIYDKIAGYWKDNGSSIGSNFAALFHSAIDFGKTALKAAYDFVTGFADTVWKAGKGTIGAAIIDVIADAMNDAWDGAGDGLKEKAKEWRAEAAELWEASPLDVAIETTFGGDGNPMDLDGSTIEVGVNYVSSGANLTPLRGPTGKPVITYQNNELQTQLQSGKWTSATDWARKLGGAGQTDTSAFIAEIKTWKANGFNLSASEIEKLTSAFVSGRDEYEKAKAEREAPAKEEAEIGIKGAEEEAKIEKEGEKDGAGIEKAGAKDAAATEKEAALTFRQQIEKAVKDTDDTWRKSNQALRFGIDETGRKWAVIGQVAQQQWEAAGKRWADDVSSSAVKVDNALATGAGKIDLAGGQWKNITDLSGSKFKLDVVAAAIDHSSKVKSSITDWVTRYSIASTAEQTKLVTTGAGVRGSLTAGGNSIFNSAVAGGNSLLGGANTGANALRSAASTIGSALSKFVGGKFPWQYFATGTKTDGPQMAVIGEDGPSNPEYVIPTKTKRWDLLAAVNRDYGIPGFAEGTSTGGAAVGGEGEAPPMSATFGITGLASMAKQVKKIITDLKDFFRISWGIVKAEGSTYWKQINTVITTEVTAIRDTGWQAALDIRNAWLEMSKTITDDAKASWVAYWPAIEPTINSLKESLIGAFTDAGSGMKDAIDSMVLNSEASLQAFEASWSEIWSQLVTDMTDAQAKISEGVAQIAAELQKISVNVNISVGGGGGGGGSGGGFPGDWDFGGGGDWLAPTGDWSGTWSDYGSVCGQSFNDAVWDSIMPGDMRYTGAGLGGGGRVPATGGGYWQLPSIFMAKGALVEKPTEAIIGEAGPEMVLPAKLTRMFVSLADIGLGSSGGSAKDKIVIEDRTEHHWYMDGKEVTNVIMDRVMKQLQLRGAVPAK